MAVSSPQIPNAHVLLHADCNEQEVMCEISRYFPRGSLEGADPAYFMVSLSVEGVEFSTALILQTLAVEKDQSTLVQTKLGLPLSRAGTLLTEGESQSLISQFIFSLKHSHSHFFFSAVVLVFCPSVIFLVFSHIKSVSAPLRGDVLLNCGFKLQETPLAQEVGVEWRLQHRGKGWKVFEMKTRLDDAEGGTVGKWCV